MPFGRSLPAMRLTKQGVISLTHGFTHPSRLPPSCLLTDRAEESAAFVAKCRRCAPAECGHLCTANNYGKLSGSKASSPPSPGTNTHRHTDTHRHTYCSSSHSSQRTSPIAWKRLVRGIGVLVWFRPGASLCLHRRSRVALEGQVCMAI